MKHKPVSWIRSALTKEDDTTVEAAYIALYVVLAMAALTIVMMLSLAWVEVTLCNRDTQAECYNPGGLGGGIAAVLGALLGGLAGIGTYIYLERKGQMPAPVQETKTVTTETETVRQMAPDASAKPVPVKVVAMPAKSAPPERRVGKRKGVGK